VNVADYKNFPDYKASIDTVTRHRTYDPTLPRYGTDLIDTAPPKLTGPSRIQYQRFILILIDSSAESGVEVRDLPGL
jgi:hypothetical protein